MFSGTHSVQQLQVILFFKLFAHFCWDLEWEDSVLSTTHWRLCSSFLARVCFFLRLCFQERSPNGVDAVRIYGTCAASISRESAFLSFSCPFHINFVQVDFFFSIGVIELALQYCRVPKNGQAGISFKIRTTPGWKNELRTVSPHANSVCCENDFFGGIADFKTTPLRRLETFQPHSRTCARYKLTCVTRRRIKK